MLEPNGEVYLPLLHGIKSSTPAGEPYDGIKQMSFENLTVADRLPITSYFCGSSIMFLELADAVLLLNTEPQILALVRTRVLQLDCFPLAVERASSPLLECLVEDRAAVCALQL